MNLHSKSSRRQVCLFPIVHVFCFRLSLVHTCCSGMLLIKLQYHNFWESIIFSFFTLTGLSLYLWLLQIGVHIYRCYKLMSTFMAVTNWCPYLWLLQIGVHTHGCDNWCPYLCWSQIGVHTHGCYKLASVLMVVTNWCPYSYSCYKLVSILMVVTNWCPHSRLLQLGVHTL